MQTSLIEAKSKLNVSRMKNPAIIWETPLTEIDELEELLDKAIERTGQIGEFQDAFENRTVDENAPEWVKKAHKTLDLKTALKDLSEEELETINKITPSLIELAESEYGQRIGSEYEALNTVVSGGTRIQAKNLKESHRSLLDTLNAAAGWRSIIRFQADDYKEAYAHVFIGYLKANMGYVADGIKNFKEAKKLMDEYPDGKNLAIFRNTPNMSQKTIKGLINSSIRELNELNKDPSKYSTGWWKRLRYYNQSIGGQTNPSIQDMSEVIQSRYYTRMFWAGILAGICFLGAGRYGKRWRNAKKYEVKHEEYDI